MERVLYVVYNLKESIGTKSLSKTLRFTLIPQNQTREYLSKNLLKEEEVDLQFEQAKLILDGIYRKIIEDSLAESHIDWKDLADAYESKDQAIIEKAQTDYRKQIADLFSKQDGFKNLFGSKLLKDVFLGKYDDVITKEDKLCLQEFANRTVRFTGFFSNRKNIFSKEAITTSVTYRIVHVNFNKFLANIKNYGKLEELISEGLIQLSEQIYGNRDIDMIKKNFFEINCFNNFLLQKDINQYNSVVGGWSESKAVKIKGINELINEYVQKTGTKCERMYKLDKQILSEMATRSFRWKPIENNEELINEVIDYIQLVGKAKLSDSVNSLFHDIDTFNGESIFLSRKLVSQISINLFGEYNAISELLKQDRTKELLTEKKKLSKKDEKEILAYLGVNTEGEFTKTSPSYSVSKLSEILSESKTSISEYLSQTAQDLTEELESSIKQVTGELNREFDKSAQQKNSIKQLFDTIIKLSNLVKGFISENIIELDANFYEELDSIKDLLDQGLANYNRVRNYLTKKDYSKEKIPLTFNINGLLGGWAKSKESDNRGLIFRENGKYYLGILLNAKLKFKEVSNKNEEVFEKMDLIFLPGPEKMIPKSSIALKEVKAHFAEKMTDYNITSNKKFLKSFTITREIFDLYYPNGPEDTEAVKKFQVKFLKENPNKKQEHQDALITWIDFCKEFLNAYEGTKEFDFSLLKESGQYADLSEFYRDVASACYKLSFYDVSKSQVYKSVENQELLLFQIYNKDFSDHHKGKENLHTLFFKGVFSEENDTDKVFKLNGGAEIFYRKSSIKHHVTHKKGDWIVNRTFLEDGQKITIPERLIPELNSFVNDETLHLSQEAQYYLPKLEKRMLDYDIIKDKRYTVDKFFLHVPITINPDVVEVRANTMVSDWVKNGNIQHIIGIDRGEKNLLYYTVLDMQGNIVEQADLNTVNQVNYQQKLVTREKERDFSRKSWQEIGNIKNLKEGYLSAIVHQLALLIEKYGAIIVMENLNMGFKRGRMKVERQVYQKFEKMLTDKLQYMSFKDRPASEYGGIARGYQLTGDFKEGQNNNGILFYVTAGYTSKIDPTTGFVNVFNFKKLKDAKLRKEFFEKFNTIFYKKDEALREDYFVFDFSYSKFETYQSMHRDDWQVCTVGHRSLYNPKTKKEAVIHLNTEMKKILNEFGVSYSEDENLIEKICQNEQCSKKVLDLFRLTVKLRNNLKNEMTPSKIEDCIISPVKNSEGVFFNSMNGDPTLPKDSDANGAYCIARKGLAIVNKNRLASHDERFDYVLSNTDWFKEMQQ